ncbi:peptidoglycan recognition protein family protein [Streptomyces sp. NPDC004822]
MTRLPLLPDQSSSALASSPAENADGIARRRVLYGLGALTAAPALASCTQVNGSHRAAQPAPKAAMQVARADGPASRVQHTEFPITVVGLTWTGLKEGIRVRLYDQEGRPGAWKKVAAGCPCGADKPSSRRSGPAPSRAFVSAGGSRGYELDVPDGMEVLDAIAVDAGPTPLVFAEHSQAPGKSSLTRTGPEPLQFPPPALIRRAQWGADESKRFTRDGLETTPTRFFPAQALIVHHTVTSNDDPDPAATVRAIYALHATGNGWGDIGYHFLIDKQGRIYEGRWSGKDSLPAHDERKRVVTGFHTAGFNSGNIGVSLLGDFTKGAPSPAMRRSLTELLASLSHLHGLDPREAITYRNPLDGRSRRALTVSGHQDWTPTRCPGDLTYAELRGIRADVAKLLANV